MQPEKKLTVSSSACLTHTGEMFRYEDLELGQENFDRLADHGVYFLYSQGTGEDEEMTYYRELYGSAEKAATALLDSETDWMVAILAGETTLSLNADAENRITATVHAYGNIFLTGDGSLTAENLNVAEGCDVIREVATRDELEAAAEEDIVTLIRITGDLTVTAENGVGLTIDKKIEAADGVTLSITAGEFGCDVSDYVPAGYICSPLRKDETAKATNGSEENGNLVDNLYVVYKQVTSFSEMQAAQNEDTVGAIYVAGDVTATTDSEGNPVTITKPIEIGWNENAQQHYDLNVTGILYINAPFQRFGFEKLGRVGMASFDEMAEDGICFLMKNNETRELYGSPDMAQAALEEATASNSPYMMATLNGTFGYASSYCDCKFSEEYGFIRIGSPIQVTGMLVCYGHIAMLDNSSLIAPYIWQGGGGLACTYYTYTYVLEGYSGTLIVHGDSSSGGGGSNLGSNVNTTTTKNDDGSVTTTTTNKNTGTVTETTKTPTGITGTTVSKEGEITSVSASVPTSAVKAAEKSGETITLPVEVPAAESPKDAVEVKIDIPASVDSLTVEIPVSNMSSGTVAILVHSDGTEEILKSSAMGENGLLVTLEEDAVIKIVDNSKEFSDVHAVDHWAKEAIDFVSSRELFNGTTETTFTPDAPTTRAQLMTVLARLDGTDTSGSALEKGLAWAVENGISDGSNPSGTISRQQLAVMLWRYAGSPAAESETLNFTDADQVSDYAQEAMRWATENGILNGYANGSLNPLGTATRAHVAQMIKNFIQSGVL